MFAGPYQKRREWSLRVQTNQRTATRGCLSFLTFHLKYACRHHALLQVPVVAMALGIARALTHLHSKRIIHGGVLAGAGRGGAEPGGWGHAGGGPCVA